MKQVIELRPNRDLLDNDFSGYKLSLDAIPLYEKSLHNAVDQVYAGDEQFSYAHVRIFSLHNHLHVNPHTPGLLYYVNEKWTVMQVTMGLMNRVESIQSVCEIPHGDRRAGDFPLTLQFASADRAIIADGTGTFHVAAVKKDKWVIVFSDTLQPGGPQLVASVLQTNDRLHILTHSVLEPKFHSRLHLLVLDQHWQTVTTKTIDVGGNLQYTSIESPSSIVLISDGRSHPKFVTASAEAPSEPKYIWTQTADDVLIVVNVGSAEESEVIVQCEQQCLQVSVQDEIVISGVFAGEVSNVSWMIKTGKLDIFAQKNECGVAWKQAIQGDDSGEQYQTEGERCKQEATFNSEELEEVDVAAPAALLRLDLTLSDVTHEVDLSTQQYLFSVTNNAKKSPAICLRHLSDACVWQLENHENAWQQMHIGTFSAFGYVQASKTQRKFIVAPENMSYVVIADAFRHLYIFRQPSAVNGTLRNRTSGTRVGAIARQQLVNLDSSDEIIGIRATNELLFILTKKKIFTLVVNETLI